MIPRVVELEVELHHGCPSSDHRSVEVVKLEVGLLQRCFIRKHEVSRGGEALMGLHYQRCKEVKFMMELHHGSPKEHEASVGAYCKDFHIHVSQ